MQHMVIEFPLPGITSTWATFYRMALPENPSVMPKRGVLPNGRPYEIRCMDVTAPEDMDKGIKHYYVYCNSEGKDVGHARFWFGDKYLDEFDRTVHFDGWYLFEAFVEPQFRRNGIYRLLIERGSRIARNANQGGRYISAYTHKLNLASSKALESIGFSNESTVLFINIFGTKKLFEKNSADH